MEIKIDWKTVAARKKAVWQDCLHLLEFSDERISPGQVLCAQFDYGPWRTRRAESCADESVTAQVLSYVK